jgi:hypothetical protein
VDRLAKTQDEMRKTQDETLQTQGQMLKSISALARQVGGLSERFGAELEVFASEVVQGRLHDERGWEVGVLKNETVSLEKGEVEFDLFGEARDPKRPEAILGIAGETKVALSERELARSSVR